MSILDVILTSLVSVLTGSNVYTIFYIKSLKKVQAAKADEAADAVLYKRLTFLDERVSVLEDYIKTHTCSKAAHCKRKV